MLKRTISGAVYVAIIAGFFLLRELTPYPWLFHILLWFMGAMGTFEIARAVKEKAVKGSFITAIIFGVLFAPVYLVSDYFLKGWGWLIAIDIALILAFAFAIYCLIKGNTFKQCLYSILPFFYPSLFILTTHITNDIVGVNGFIALLLIFVVSPLTDTMAYLVGMTYNKIRKGQAKKLCPNLSPKKTIAGAIGGLFGGAIGGLLIWAIFRPEIDCFSTLGLLLIMGFVAGALTQVGDLFESFIKRKVGIKDIGKIMPGHGGVMDRIDGTLFASVLVCIVFLFI